MIEELSDEISRIGVLFQLRNKVEEAIRNNIIQQFQKTKPDDMSR